MLTLVYISIVVVIFVYTYISFCKMAFIIDGKFSFEWDRDHIFAAAIALPAFLLGVVWPLYLLIKLLVYLLKWIVEFALEKQDDV